MPDYLNVSNVSIHPLYSGCNFTMIFNENYTLQEKCDMIDCTKEGYTEFIDFVKIYNCYLN